MNLTYLGDVGSQCGRQINQNLSGLRKWRHMYFLVIIIVFSIALVVAVLIVVLLKSSLWVQVTLGKLTEVIASIVHHLYTHDFSSAECRMMLLKSFTLVKLTSFIIPSFPVERHLLTSSGAKGKHFRAWQTIWTKLVTSSKGIRK